MRRSQRLLQKVDSNCGICSHVSRELEATRKITNLAKNDICCGSSHLQREANVDSSSAATSKFPGIAHSMDILAGLGTEILSEQLPPHQESFVLADTERRTKSNSDTLMGNKLQRSLPFSGPHTSLEGLKRKASSSAPKERVKTTKSAKNSKQLFVVGTTLAGEAATLASTEPTAVQTEIAMGPKTVSAANVRSKRSGNNKRSRPANSRVTSKPKRVRNKPRTATAWTLPPNFENSNTEINLTAPLRLADFRNKHKVQPMEGGCGPYFDNAVDPRFMALNSVRESLLPKVYPPHFDNQVPPEAVNSAHSMHSLPWQANVGASCLTPELTQPYYFEQAASASTTSLPESLGTFFEADDIREILNVGKALYHLSVQHVQALAIMLNVDFDYLLGAIEKVLKLDSYLLETIDSAFGASATGGAGANDGSDALSSGSSIVGCSQSSVDLRHFPSQR